MILRPALAVALLASTCPARAETLTERPDLAPDVAALPRLAADTAAARAINAQLEKLDAKDLAAVMCYGGSQPDGPFRSVEVLSEGPEFLSLQIMTSSYCDGAAHPWSQQSVVNFDLETGVETDLMEYLPATYRSAEDDGNLLRVLFLNNVSNLPGDCAAAYAYAWREGYLDLDLGIAEAQGALLLWPDGLSYADAPCLDAAFVPAERLREAGFDARLIKALTP